VYLIVDGLGHAWWRPCEPGDAVLAYSVLGVTSETVDVPFYADHSEPLIQCTPNPLRRETVISFNVEQRGPVRIAVYDAVGRLVRVLRNSDCRAGINTVRWDGTNSSGNRVAAGVYLVKMNCHGEEVSAKVLVAR